jgi:hypothetical protein
VPIMQSPSKLISFAIIASGNDMQRYVPWRRHLSTDTMVHMFFHWGQ